MGKRSTAPLLASLLVLGFLHAVPARADMPAGVWTGTLGRATVLACLEPDRGTYYYEKVGVDIALVERKAGTWDEKSGDAPSTGTWLLSTSISTDTSFSVWPSTEGLVFEPGLPHVIASCATPVTVPYATLAGKLTPAGKRAVEEFKAAIQPARKP